MTHPTKAIYKWLLSDYLRVSHIGDEDQLYTEEDLINSFHRIEAIDYHQQVEVEGIKFTAYNAGHVLGAAMFLIEIAGVKVLYTGDYSREEDRHLMAAEKPEGSVDVLITESTYGVQSHEPRLAKETRFTCKTHTHTFRLTLLIDSLFSPCSRYRHTRWSMSHASVCSWSCTGTFAHLGRILGGTPRIG